MWHKDRLFLERRKSSLLPLIVAGVMIMLVWFFCMFGLMFIVNERRSNCIFYAVKKCWYEGGQMLIEESKWGWWAHVSHIDQSGKVTEFIPLAPKRKRRIPPLVFTGRVAYVGHMAYIKR